MSLIATAKFKVCTGKFKEAFKNEAGAIDLASIMVGIIVIGLIGGIIAATVFAVIPWAQDNAAKQQLDSVAAAQAAYIGLSADKGDIQFGGGPVTITIIAGKTSYAYTKVATVGGDGLIAEKLFNGSSNSKLAVGMWGVGSYSDGAHFGAAVKSSSGKTWYISDKKTKPTTLDDTQKVADASKPANELEAIIFKVRDL